MKYFLECVLEYSLCRLVILWIISEYFLMTRCDDLALDILLTFFLLYLCFPIKAALLWFSACNNFLLFIDIVFIETYDKKYDKWLQWRKLNPYEYFTLSITNLIELCVTFRKTRLWHTTATVDWAKKRRSHRIHDAKFP